MNWLLFALFLYGVYVWLRAWFALRKTSLGHAAVWALVAWLGWGAVLLYPAPPVRYLALCLTACAGVAVLGARRPHVMAWNFVVLALLAVLMLPWLEGLVLGHRQIGFLWITFLASLLLVVASNYLPTCLGPAAFVGGLGCGAQLLCLAYPPFASGTIVLASDLALLAIPGIGQFCWTRRTLMELQQAFRPDVCLTDRFEQFNFDRVWLGFRDRYGLVWSMRLREQFNHAARNAGHAVVLGWHGLTAEQARALSDSAWAELRATLKALMKRFVD